MGQIDLVNILTSHTDAYRDSTKNSKKPRLFRNWRGRLNIRNRAKTAFFKRVENVFCLRVEHNNQLGATLKQSAFSARSQSKFSTPRHSAITALFKSPFSALLRISPKSAVKSGGSCRTMNTTTSFKGPEGTIEQFPLINPANCRFPFNYKGTWHEGCIAQDDPFCRRVSSGQ